MSERALRSRIGLRALMSGLAALRSSLTALRSDLTVLRSGLTASRSVLNEFRTRGKKGSCRSCLPRHSCSICDGGLILSKRAELLQRREYGNCQDIH